MKTLKIDPTEDTPAILLDADKGVFKIKGRSLPEDAQLFYQPIVDWITQYCTKPNPNTDFIFELEYYNSASAKIFLNILEPVEKIHDHKTQATISWVCHPDNKDMKKDGELFAKIVTIPLKIITSPSTIKKTSKKLWKL